jgi:hypothetical protein
LLAVPLYRHQPYSQAFVIVNEGSKASTFDDIRGTVHAFSDPDSTSGYLITRWLLALRRNSPAEFFRSFFFTYGHRNVIRAVANGLAESGSIEGYVWEVMKEREPELVDKTRIVFRSGGSAFRHRRIGYDARSSGHSGAHSGIAGHDIGSPRPRDFFVSGLRRLYDGERRSIRKHRREVAGGEGAGVMLRLLHVAAWPLAVKVPVLAADLMITVATTISYVVLWRFVQDQESNLELLASTYLDGVSASVLPAIAREDVWEVYDALDRARRRYAGVEPRFTIVALPNGRVLAASDPRRFPFQSIVPDELRKRFPTHDGFIIDAAAGQAWLARTLQAGGFPVGRLFAELDVTDLLRLRHEILLTLILVNGGLTLAFALGAYFALKRMVQPVTVLIRYVEKIRDGRVEPIPEGYRNRIASEFGELFDRFNAMAGALGERQSLAAQLAETGKIRDARAARVGNGA